MEWSGGDGSGVEWRGGKGRAGQGRVPDCLGGLSRVGISSRSTRPWNGQPPSFHYEGCSRTSNQHVGTEPDQPCVESTCHFVALQLPK